MSIAGILSSSLLNLTTPSATSPQQSFQKEFQQLGQDLQSGNLSAAQADFATLQQNSPSSSAAAAQTSSPIAQAFSQLGKDLQSGNLAGAQQDFSTIQQDVQSQSTQGHHHHHHGGGGGGGSSTSQQSTLAQEFAQLSQDLQAGNLSAAQQAYSSVQQSFPGFAGSTAATALSSTA
jgi:outer membrane protein assembly factor BamD (BamD/ComL family)